jgi:hypothetical protein
MSQLKYDVINRFAAYLGEVEASFAAPNAVPGMHISETGSSTCHINTSYLRADSLHNYEN